MKTVAVFADSVEVGAEVHGDVADDFLFGEPAGSGTVEAMDSAEAKVGGEMVKDEREIAREFGWPALAKTGAGHEKSLRDGTRFGSGRVVEVDAIAADDHVDVGA